MTTFSVIIPCFNALEQISCCVNSVLEQSEQNFEIIVIDDGSTDGTHGYLQKLRDTRVQTIYNTQNVGPGEARNRGIDIAQNKYILFLDADDYLPKDTLANLQQIIGNNSPDFVWGRYQIQSDESVVVSQSNPEMERSDFNRSEIIDLYLQDQIVSSPWAKAFRRSIIVKHSIKFPSLRMGEDGPFNLKFLLKANTFSYTDQIIYAYRKHEANVTVTTSTEQYYANTQTSLSLIENELEQENLTSYHATSLALRHFRFSFKALALRKLSSTDTSANSYELLDKTFANNPIPLLTLLHSPLLTKKERLLIFLYKAKLFRIAHFLLIHLDPSRVGLAYKLRQRLKRSLFQFYFSDEEKYFLETIRPELSPPTPSKPSQGIILFDLPNKHCEMVENLACAKYFSQNNYYEPRAYLPYLHLSLHQGLYSFIRKTMLYFFKSVRFIRELGIDVGLGPSHITNADRKTANNLADKLITEIGTKEQLANFTIGGVNIGRTIYDSYLRTNQCSTVDFSDPKYQKTLKEACLIYVTTKRYLQENPIEIVILGHAVYNNWQILSDLAVTQEIDVFVTYNARRPPLHHVNSNRGLQTTDHTTYPDDFLQLDEEYQREAKQMGHDLIQKRLDGHLDDSINYMAHSAFMGGGGFEFHLEKKALVFMVHSLSDSPHIYESMVFADFFEWLKESFEFIKKSKLYETFEILVKPHPNGFDYEKEEIRSIVSDYSFIKILPPDFNNQFLSPKNVAAIVSVYGSVAAEFTMLGIPVILCGDNPTSAYSFSFEAKTRQQYFSFLSMADKLEVSETDRDQVSEFVYMHFLHGNELSFDDFPFSRYKRGDASNPCRYRNFTYSKYKEILDSYFSQKGV